MDQEIWRPIREYEGLYEVSNKGRVRSLDRYVTAVRTKYRPGTYTYKQKGVIMKPIFQNGYYQVPLCKGGVSINHLIHRLVATAFLPNPENHPIINHIDCNGLNNNVENLEWCTYKHNAEWCVECGRHSSPTEAFLESNKIKVYCPELDKEFSSVNEAKRELNLHSDYITACLRNKGRKSKRYYEVQNIYTIIRIEDKEDYLTYIASENAIIRPMFEYGRHAVNLKDGQVFNSFRELSDYYDIPEGSKGHKVFSQYDGYLPMYDCYLVDIGYRNYNPFTVAECHNKMNDMRCKFVRTFGRNIIRCDTTGELYHSAKYAEEQLGLPSACIRERLSIYDGWYYKKNLHFSEVPASELTDEEALSIADSLVDSFNAVMKSCRKNKL